MKIIKNYHVYSIIKLKKIAQNKINVLFRYFVYQALVELQNYSVVADSVISESIICTNFQGTLFYEFCFHLSAIFGYMITYLNNDDIQGLKCCNRMHLNVCLDSVSYFMKFVGPTK